MTAPPAGNRLLVLDVARADALHLATALALHAKTCRANGLVLPTGLADLASRCWEIARGDHEGPEGPPFDFVDRMAQRGPMLLTIAEAAEALRLSERKVKRLVAAGAIPSVTIDSARRIRVDDLAAYVDSLGPRSFRAGIESKDAPGSRSPRPAGRRVAGAGAHIPARAPDSQPRGAA